MLMQDRIWSVTTPAKPTAPNRASGYNCLSPEIRPGRANRFDANNGGRPKSWDELASVEPAYDFESVAKQIDFDLNANPVELAKQSPQEFVAIKQKTEYYEIEPEIQTIIDTLRKYHGSQ